MFQNFRGKYTKDTETAAETIIPNIHLSSSFLNRMPTGSNMNTGSQQASEENSDAVSDKRSKK